MIVIDSTVTSPDPDSEHGADITAAEYNSKIWWGTVVFFNFYDEVTNPDGVWYWDDVLMLPMLHDPADFSGLSGIMAGFVFTFEENEKEMPFDIRNEEEEYALLPEEEDVALPPEREEDLLNNIPN